MCSGVQSVLDDLVVRDDVTGRAGRVDHMSAVISACPSTACRTRRSFCVAALREALAVAHGLVPRSSIADRGEWRPHTASGFTRTMLKEAGIRMLDGPAYGPPDESRRQACFKL